MSRAQAELDRLGSEAWDGLAGDIRTTGRRLGRAGAACARNHPVILLGTVSLLAAFTVWRLKRPASPVLACPPAAAKRPGIASRLFRMGRLGLALALSIASNRAENRPS